MAEKVSELSFEARLFASLRPERHKLLARTSSQSTRISHLRDCGAISKADVDRDILREPRRLKTPRRAQKRALRFGRIPQNADFLEFTRSKPCILIGKSCQSGKTRHTHVCSGKIEAAHTGRRGLKQKAADETALAMCSSAHRTGRFAHHKGSRVFWSIWGLNREELVKENQRAAREVGIYVADVI